LLALAGALLAAVWASPAAAQVQPAPPAETWLGCPAGYTLETAPDPRGLLVPLGTMAPAEPRLMVRCVQRRAGPPPVCPVGFRVAVVLGPDKCAAGQPLAAPRPGGATDGTSNTVMIGETPPGTMRDGSSNTIMVGESATPSLTSSKGSGPITTRPTVPACTISFQLVPDAGGLPADLCIARSFLLPADRVNAPAR
jgi:hypothetical protein